MANPTEEEILVRGVIASIMPTKVAEVEARSDELLKMVTDGMGEMNDEQKAVELMALSLFGVKIKAAVEGM